MKSNSVCNNLLDLQNKIKRDSIGYAEDFHQTHVYFKTCIELFEMDPGQTHRNLQQLVSFLSAVTPCYPDELGYLPEYFKSLLFKHKNVMHSQLRMALVKALTFYRNRNIVTPIFILETFFQICTCSDKHLRTFIKKFMKSDIMNLNKKHKDNKLNGSLQTFLFSKLKVSNEKISKVALNILIEMFRKRVWTDAKLVNNVADCLFTNTPVILVKALTFFVRRNDAGEIEQYDSDSGQESDTEKKQKHEKQLKSLLQANQVTKKTKRKARKIEKAKKLLKKENKEAKTGFNLPALHLIYNPQSLAERLLKWMVNYNGKFHIKLMMMDLISRLIGLHQLQVLNFYPFLQRYLHAHQKDVTKVLLFAAQATHEEVPPDVIEALIKTICHNFVTDHNADEVIAVGLNSIREIISRHPTALNDSKDLVEDIIHYKKHRNRGVITSARTVLSLLRDVNPALLKSKDRGKPSEFMQETLSNNKAMIPGAEVLLNEEKDDEDSENEEMTAVSDDNEEEPGDDDGSLMADDDEGEEGDEVSDSDLEEDSGDENESGDQDSETEGEPSSKKTKIDSEAEPQTTEDLLRSRILTDEDFKKIKIENLRKKMQFASKSGKKAKEKKSRKSREPEEAVIDSDDLENESSDSEGELPSYEAIARVNIKKRHDKESKLASVLAGREDREKFGRPQKRQNPHASTTNKEKTKKKNFMMMRQKSKKNKKFSFQEKQAKLRNSLKRRYKK